MSEFTSEGEEERYGN